MPGYVKPSWAQPRPQDPGIGDLSNPWHQPPVPGNATPPPGMTPPMPPPTEGGYGYENGRPPFTPTPHNYPKFDPNKPIEVNPNGPNGTYIPGPLSQPGPVIVNQGTTGGVGAATGPVAAPMGNPDWRARMR